MNPLSIDGVVKDEVGQPSNDGSRGSALYSVPIKLSREPTPEEARLLVQNWDHPPTFTTMHRPGNASVVGDRFVIGGTTIDEVRDYHAKTLSLVVDKTNEEAADLERQREQDREAAERDAEAHREHVEEVADDIDFGG